MSVVEAHGVASAAEEAASRGAYAEAASLHRHAASLFRLSLPHIADPQSKNALRLIAETQQRRAQELQFLADTTTKQESIRDNTAKKPQPQSSLSPSPDIISPTSSSTSFGTAPASSSTSTHHRSRTHPTAGTSTDSHSQSHHHHTSSSTDPLRGHAADHDVYSSPYPSTEGFWHGLEKLMDLLPSSTPFYSSSSTAANAYSHSHATNQHGLSSPPGSLTSSGSESDSQMLSSFLLVPSNHPSSSYYPPTRPPGVPSAYSTSPTLNSHTNVAIGSAVALPPTSLHHPKPRVLFADPVLLDSSPSPPDHPKSTSLPSQTGTDPTSASSDLELCNRESLMQMVRQLQDTVLKLQAENGALREACENGALAHLENETLKRSIVVFKEELRNKYLDRRSHLLVPPRLSSSSPGLVAATTANSGNLTSTPAPTSSPPLFSPSSSVGTETGSAPSHSLVVQQQPQPQQDRRIVACQRECEELRATVLRQQEELHAWEAKWEKLRLAAKKRMQSSSLSSSTSTRSESSDSSVASAAASSSSSSPRRHEGDGGDAIGSDSMTVSQMLGVPSHSSSS
mmetsp:Transcript_18626/g.55804  ORF Transcript_18626/g.55804 Transcript_18626/m.55804 type:complete len:568 (+) Transcript_18626:102-1805(+)